MERIEASQIPDGEQSGLSVDILVDLEDAHSFEDGRDGDLRQVLAHGEPAKFGLEYDAGNHRATGAGESVKVHRQRGRCGFRYQQLRGRRGLHIGDHRSPRRSSSVCWIGWSSFVLTRPEKPPMTVAGRNGSDGRSRPPGGTKIATTSPWLVMRIVSPAATSRSTALLLFRNSRCAIVLDIYRPLSGRLVV